MRTVKKVDDNDKQSRESATQILEVRKDIEHLQYVIRELEKECKFVKDHFSTKNGDRVDDIKSLHMRLDKNLKVDSDFQEVVRKKITSRFDMLDERIRQLERWKWASWGGIVIIGTFFSYYFALSKNKVGSFFGD